MNQIDSLFIFLVINCFILIIFYYKMAFCKHIAFSLTISLPLSPQTEFLPLPFPHVCPIPTFW